MNIINIQTGHDFLSPLTDFLIGLDDAATATIGRLHVLSDGASAYTVTLPAASGNSGKFVSFFGSPFLTQTITLDGNGSETINGAANMTITAGDAVMLYCNGSNWFKIADSVANASSSTDIYGVCNGRLTTESGVGVSSSDRTSQGTIYFTPWNGSQVGLYNGSSWTIHTFTERSLALSSLTSGKNYDVFLYNNSGTLTLELSAAWTNNTTRADALTLQNGIYVKSGSTTRRYLGTICTTGTTTTEDSLTKRFLWNLYNQVPRPLYVVDTADSWAHTIDAFRQARGSSANQVEFVQGLPQRVVANSRVYGGNSGSAILIAAGIGLDSTTVNSARLCADATPAAGASVASTANYEAIVSAGYHYLAWLERGSATTGTTTFFGDGGQPSNSLQNGLMATIWG